MRKVIVVDYGIVNLKNIMRGLEFVGGQVSSSVRAADVINADRVVLPGVGAFDSGMAEIRALGMDEAIKTVAIKGRPVLGICLGQQMFLGSSTEYGDHKGLGIIPGTVVPIPSGEAGVKRRKVPHVGWNSLCRPVHSLSWADSCLESTPLGTFCYFSHSFMVRPDNNKHILAECNYEGTIIAAAINKENITGLQFHPERSGPVGLQILDQFLKI